MELNFHVAVDFTASNGDPATPSSLHFLNQNQMNSYEFAIHSIGEVLEQYDTDKLFPAYGFGARIPPHGMVSHDFALNGNVVIDNMVCDVTKFLKEHPGGSDVILDFAGKDATESFNDVGHSNDAKQMLTEYKIGVLSEVEITKKDSKKTDGDGCAIM